jgi:hypothetical protein
MKPPRAPAPKDHRFEALPVAKRSTRAGCPWLVCDRCGLVRLKNDATRKAERSGLGIS